MANPMEIQPYIHPQQSGYTSPLPPTSGDALPMKEEGAQMSFGSFLDSLGDVVVGGADRYVNNYLQQEFGTPEGQVRNAPQPVYQPQVGTTAAPIAGPVTAGDAQESAIERQDGQMDIKTLAMIGIALFAAYKGLA